MSPQTPGLTTVQQNPIPNAMNNPDEVVYLENTAGNFNKFYEISRKGAVLLRRWGPIGKTGNSQSETKTTSADAKTEMQKLLGEKLKKGYVQKANGASMSQPPTVTECFVGGSMRDIHTFFSHMGLTLTDPNFLLISTDADDDAIARKLQGCLIDPASVTYLDGHELGKNYVYAISLLESRFKHV